MDEVPDVDVSGVTCDSRLVAPDSLFVAVRGDRVDGARYIGDAVRRGAAAVVVEDPALVLDSPIPAVAVEDSRRALASLAVPRCPPIVSFCIAFNNSMLGTCFQIIISCKFTGGAKFRRKV